MEDIPYPVRINRYLYLKGYSSRRRADTLIEEGSVTINGKVAQLGEKVSEGDIVLVSKKSSLPKKYRYYAYNKPIGVVSHNPQSGEKSVEDISGLGKSYFPVGRLDKASHGLMLLTNDGRIVDKLLNPKYAHDKEYVVKVDKRITDSALKRMSNGVNIEGYHTKPAEVRRVNDTTFYITLIEGKKHQIRRMASALGYTVMDLKRTRIMNINLGSLKEGLKRELSDKERRFLLESLTTVEARPQQ